MSGEHSRSRNTVRRYGCMREIERVEFEEFKTRPKRIENYHHPRHLMLNLLSVERMLKKMPVK
jgi:hypothetical protein